MSRSNILTPFKIVNAVSMAASITSTITNTQYLDNVGIQGTFTGAPTGAFSVQISADHAEDANGNVTVTGNWVTLTLSPAPTASGSGDSFYIDLNQLSAPWIRLVYTRTSGTGSLTAYITAKHV